MNGDRHVKGLKKKLRRLEKKFLLLEYNVKKARGLLRLTWQMLDHSGESMGRTCRCASLEVAMELLGPADSEECRKADIDPRQYVIDAQNELSERKMKDIEKQDGIK